MGTFLALKECLICDDVGALVDRALDNAGKHVRRNRLGLNGVGIIEAAPIRFLGRRGRQSAIIDLPSRDDTA